MKNTSWYSKYKPNKIEDLVLNDKNTKNLIENIISNQTIPGNMLLYGPGGTGKTSTCNVIVKNNIKSKHDLKIVKERSVDYVTNVIKPFCEGKPFESKQKIIYIEEIDKIKSIQAISELKNEILEKYQENCAFLATTNYIHLIEENLKKRFNLRKEFKTLSNDSIFERIKYILDNENVNYDKEKLKEFINKNYSDGFREIINKLQINSYENKNELNFEDNNIYKNIEEDIIKNIENIINKFIDNKSIEMNKFEINPSNSIVSEEYNNICSLSYNNYDINYDYIFHNLVDKYNNTFLLKKLFAKYYEELEFKKIPEINLIDCVLQIPNIIKKIKLV